MTCTEADTLTEASARVLSQQLPDDCAALVVVVRVEDGRLGLHCAHDLDDDEDAVEVLEALVEVLRAGGVPS